MPSLTPHYAKHLATAIQAQLHHDLPASDMALYSIPSSINTALEDRVFAITAHVAQSLACRLHYSNFHTLGILQPLSSDVNPSLFMPSVQHSTLPFATCLDMVVQVTNALKTALLADEELKGYADAVQKLSNCQAATPTALRKFHCITAIRFKNECVVVDLCAQSSAFRIPLSACFSCQELTNPWNGVPYSIAYCHVPGPDNARMLVDCSLSVLSRHEKYMGPFTRITYGTFTALFHYMITRKKALENIVGERTDFQVYLRMECVVLRANTPASYVHGSGSG
jgi:hypothetical protein